MKRTCCCVVALTLAALAGCSSGPPATDTRQSAVTLDRIQGKAQVMLAETTATDAALNAGGPSVYLVDGVRRYRLFMKTLVEVEPGKEYIAEGVHAQKMIDELGDPSNGKGGYPLQASCEKVVKSVWGGLSFDVTDGHVSVVRARVKRHPARPLFLVTKLTPAPAKEGAAAKPADEDIPEITVPPEKQRTLLAEGPTVLPAPLWEPAGGTVQCKVIIGPDGKIAELETGGQLCESVPWSKYRYQPTSQKGRPVKVKTTAEVRFDPRT